MAAPAIECVDQPVAYLRMRLACGASARAVSREQAAFAQSGGVTPKKRRFAASAAGGIECAEGRAEQRLRRIFGLV